MVSSEDLQENYKISASLAGAICEMARDYARGDKYLIERYHLLTIQCLQMFIIFNVVSKRLYDITSVSRVTDFIDYFIGCVKATDLSHDYYHVVDDNLNVCLQDPTHIILEIEKNYFK